MANRTLTLESLIEAFRLSCQVEGKSPKTIEWYLDFLGRFQRFRVLRDNPPKPSRIDRSHIREFILHLQTEAINPHNNGALSPITVQGYVRTLKAFFSWAKREEYIADNPMTGIAIPRAPRKMVNTFTTDQIAALLNLCRSSNHSGHRNTTIILLFFDTGIRVSELVNISIDDVILDEGRIKIKRAKGN